jgi:hypothetical protein
MTKAEKVRRLAKLKGSYKLFAAKCLKIKTKSGAIRPLIFNGPQKYIDDKLNEQLSKTGKIRALILKGRQQGASTYTEGRFYWRTALSKGKQAYILTHEQAATDNLFGMAKRYHDNCHAGIRPVTKAANAKELSFGALDSGYKIGTAGSKAVGRSGTIQYFHGSELGFWPNADEHFAGVVQCIADAAGTEIILESTANGVGGKFHELWMKAQAGEGDYIAIFVPWFWSPEYRANATGFVPTKDELKKQTLYGVTLEQLAWRRAKTNEIGKDLTDQEYPYCWQDAFLSSGRTVFDKDHMSSAIKETWKPIEQLELSGGQWIKRDDGRLKVWQRPERGVKYFIGADVAEGLETGDYSSADVLESPSGRQVAQWHGKCPPDVYGKIILKSLGNWYNQAFIGVENNNHGLATNIALRDSGYANLYVEHRLDDRGSNDKETKRLGWMTTSKSKPYIIDQLAAELRDGTHGLACKETVQEMQTFIVLENGSYSANLNCHDDRVMSRAIAGEMLRQQRI